MKVITPYNEKILFPKGYHDTFCSFQLNIKFISKQFVTIDFFSIVPYSIVKSTFAQKFISVINISILYVTADDKECIKYLHVLMSADIMVCTFYIPASTNWCFDSCIMMLGYHKTRMRHQKIGPPKVTFTM